MTTYNRLHEIVGAAKAAAPLPTDYRDLPAPTRRRVEREAEAAGYGAQPQRFWESLLAAEAASSHFDAAAIAKAARR